MKARTRVFQQDWNALFAYIIESLFPGISMYAHFVFK